MRVYVKHQSHPRVYSGLKIGNQNSQFISLLLYFKIIK